MLLKPTGPEHPMSLPRLIALTPGDLEAARVPMFLEGVQRALTGGLDALLVREERLSDRALLDLVFAIQELAAERLWLGVHDRVHLGWIVEARAVHLGFRSLTPEVVRASFPGRFQIGLSTHAGEDPALWRAADYLFHGPVHPTPSKQGWKEPIGFDGLRAAVASTDRAVYAIGGMKPEDVRRALSSGARGVAVRSGVFASRDPARAVELYLGEFEHAPERP